MKKKIFSFVLSGMLLANLSLPVMAAEQTESISKNLEAEEPEVASTEQAPVNLIQDPNLQRAINGNMGFAEDHILTEDELLSTTYFNLEGQGITNLEGLQYAKNLEQVNLKNNQITDITILENLPNLEWAQISGNPKAEEMLYQKYFELPQEMLVGIKYSIKDMWKTSKFEYPQVKL